MNKLLYSTYGFNLNSTNNGNYSFSLGSKEFLCLNRRSVELGIGGCLVYSYFNNFRMPIYELNYLVARMGVGFGGSIKLFGYQGGILPILLALAWRSGQLDQLIEHNCIQLFGIHHIIGDGLIFAGCFGMALMGLALLIKKFGNHHLNSFLNNFNNWQDKASLTTYDLKNNLKYQFSILGQDILCIKKRILQIGLMTCVAGTFMAEFSGYQGAKNIIQSFLYTLMKTDYNVISPFISVPTSVIGIWSLFNISEIKILFFSLLGLLFSDMKYLDLVLNSAEIMYFDSAWHILAKYWLFSLCSIGKGMILGGISLGVVALLSILTKKSENPQLINLRKILETIKDPKKKIEIDADIKQQRLAIEKRQKFIASHNEAKIDLWNIDSDLNIEKSIKLNKKKKTEVKEKTALKKTDKVENPINFAKKPSTKSIRTSIEIKAVDRSYKFQKIEDSTLNKETWGIIIADSVEKTKLTKYEQLLSNGSLGGGVRQLSGFSNCYEIGTTSKCRLVGKMYDGTSLELYKFIFKENILKLSQEVKCETSNLSIIVFAREAKNHDDIHRVACKYK